MFCEIRGITIPFQSIASTGTQALKLLYVWIKRMTVASFVFVNDFGAFYNFMSAFEVCKQLIILYCQVYILSHNTYLMMNDVLRPDCIFLLSYNRIKSLQTCSEKELRFGHNIEKIYRAGVFHVEYRYYYKKMANLLYYAKEFVYLHQNNHRNISNDQHNVMLNRLKAVLAEQDSE